MTVIGSRTAVLPPFSSWMQSYGPVLVRDLSLLDVGCRGGPPEWLRRWPGRLTGVGVDPDQAEIAHLRGAARWPGMTWQAAWVGHEQAELGLPPGMNRARWRSHNNRTWRRTSSAVAQQVLAEVVPPGDPGQQTDPPPMTSVDALAAALSRIDVLKVDTDGHDLEVLESAASTLDRVLAVDVEVQLQGDPHPRANTFANIDRLVRAAGFELFDLRLHRHSRAALPSPFWGSGGSPTHTGQTVWGEAKYFRDPLASPWPQLTSDRGWMLAALFELAALPDCAVELVKAGFVPGAGDDAVQALGRGWWRDGGTRAREWLMATPAKLGLPGLPSIRDRMRRFPTERLWAPWTR